MANKPIDQLVAANDVQPNDLFPFHQNGAAKKLPAHALELWLLRIADGHGGIRGIAKVDSTGLVDTYRITLADATTYDFPVTNGNGIQSIAKAGTDGLADTYAITCTNGTMYSFVVTNGAKGEKGEAMYIHIRYASQQPTEESHSIGDVIDEWMGVYVGASQEKPDDWKLYQWIRIRGDKGNTGDPAELMSSKTEYQTSTSGTVPPSGVWSEAIPSVPQGRYLWTRVTQNYNTGDPVVSFTVSRYGIDGRGSVSSVNGFAPDEDGNVAFEYEPKNRKNVVLLSASKWVNKSQTVNAADVTADNLVIPAPAPGSYETYVDCDVRCTDQGDGTLTFTCLYVPDSDITVNAAIFS